MQWVCWLDSSGDRLDQFPSLESYFFKNRRSQQIRPSSQSAGAENRTSHPLLLSQEVCYIYSHKVTLVNKRGKQTMYTTTDERGILNNYATEPQMYYAEYPNQEQQRRYIFQGALALLLLSSLVLTALAIS